MIVVALPQVARDLKVDVAETSWIVTSYLMAVGATVGPLVGGFLAAVDWRWIFIVNVPLCAAGLALSWRVLPQRGARETARFDLVGAVGLGLVLLAAAWVLVSLGRAVDPVTVAIGVAVLPAAVALLRYESRHPDPALPPSLFRIRAFAAACATVAFQNLAMYGTLLALPVALAGASVRSGIALAAFSGGSIILAPLGGRAADRYGPRLPTVAGALLLGAGLMPLAISAGIGQLPLEFLAGTLAFAGVGLALTFPSMRLAAVEVVPERYAALASGVFSTSRYFGGMLGSIAIAIALGSAASMDSLRALFWLFRAAAFAAAIPSLALPGRAGSHEEPIAEEVAG